MAPGFHAASNKGSMAPILLMLSILLIGFQFKGAASIGVCYGKSGGNLPSDPDVVDLFKSNGIEQMRIYGPDRPVLEALRGSNIGLILGVPNPSLQSLAADAAAAAAWVDSNIKSFASDVKFNYLAVGNEVKPNDAEASSVLPAMRNLHAAITAAGLQDKIKVSTAIEFSLLEKSFPENESSFSEAAKHHMEPILSFLAENNAPLLANIYPYFEYIWDPQHKPLPYALFQAPGAYRSLFDAQVDALYTAMEKVGGGGVAVVISESGWPSAGGPAVATPENAATYYQKLIDHVKGGTVKKPSPIETYLFAMFDENQKPGEETEKHFGLFTPDKKPKYQIKFS